MKAAKKTAEILLDKTVSILPIRKARYKRCGGRTTKWKIPATIPNVPAAIWWEATPPGLNGLNPSGPHAGATGWTRPVRPKASETQIPGPNKPVTWKAPKPKQRKPDNNKWIPDSSNNNEKFVLCCNLINFIKSHYASDFINCYIYMDYLCCNNIEYYNNIEYNIY